MEDKIKELLLGAGVTKKDVLLDTPRRVVKAYRELWGGLYEPKPELTSFSGEEGQRITIQDIDYTSTCEHHLMLFTGRVTISFVSNGKILGLSKYSRLVKWCAARPTLQEYLCSMIYSELKEALDDPSELYVKVTGQHSCVSARGIKDACSNTTVEKGFLK